MTSLPPSPIGLPLASALGYAGAVIGYVPLLTVLLPIEVARVAGDDRYAALALVLAIGAMAAGAANLAFGWLGDRSVARGGGRRRWIAAGLLTMPASFAAITAAQSVAAIVLAVVAFQLSVNAILAPLMALVAEEVPPQRTALTTGLFAAAPPLAALVSLSLAAPGLATVGARLSMVAVISMLCLLPLLTMLPRTAGDRGGTPSPRISRRDLALAWTARLLVQIAGNVLFADLLYLTEPVAPDAAAIARTGGLLLLGNLLPLPIAVVIGRCAGRLARLVPSLFVAAAAAAAGLVEMAVWPGWPGRAAGFLLFATGWGVFLPLQVGYVMRLLPDADHRGRDLGVLNLANTLPVLIGQGLAWWLATPGDATVLLLALAGLTLAGGSLMLAVGTQR